MIPRSRGYTHPSNGYEKHERLTPTYAVLFNTPVEFGEDYSYYYGYDLENFHKRKRRGDLLPFTPFEQLESIASYSGSLYYTAPGGYSYQTLNNWSHPSSTVPLPPWKSDFGPLILKAKSTDLSIYVQQAAANVYSSGWDALTFTAELEKTVFMFMNLRNRFFQLLKRCIAARNKKSVNSILQLVATIPELWLEYRYGWRLIYYDIQDISKALASLDDARKRFSSRSGNTYTETSSTTGTYNGHYKFSYTRTETVEYSFRGAVVADINPPKFQFNPITTAWELITFSFIIDWFISIGKWLESLSFLVLQTQYSSAGGYKITSTRNGYIHDTSFAAGYGGTMDASDIGVSVYTRRIPMSVPLRPYVRLNLDFYKGADVLSIIASYLREGALDLAHRR